MAPIIPSAVEEEAAQLKARQDQRRKEKNRAKKACWKQRRDAKHEEERLIAEAHAAMLPPKPMTDQVGSSSGIVRSADFHAKVQRWKEARTAAALADISPTAMWQDAPRAHYLLFRAATAQIRLLQTLTSSQSHAWRQFRDRHCIVYLSPTGKSIGKYSTD